ncbi:MAG: hypothetical protein KAU36_05325 [candidate division Zixibacteria bacterium]|nr:hypothetical protein [candidate division Zixibacteria bacterium]
MKRAVVTVMVILLAVASVSAQRGMKKMPTIEDRVKELTERLDLSDEQVEQLKVIFDESQLGELMEKMQATMDDRTEMRRVGNDLRTEMAQVNKSIEEILTDEQKEEYQEYLEEMKKNRRSKSGSRR